MPWANVTSKATPSDAFPCQGRQKESTVSVASCHEASLRDERQRAGTPAAIASRPRHSERSEAESKSERAACGRRSNDGQRRLESRAERIDILRDSSVCKQTLALTGFDYGLRPALRMTQVSCASLTGKLAFGKRCDGRRNASPADAHRVTLTGKFSFASEWARNFVS